ncbi:uncharacterized protein [Triticum aestivum]|uniref:uncharacterized protein isoform X3 n=1 Tax=Triticum aestivum TaxID=4565 RepID=UPI001D028754|nr:uncharacterized protein LOC123146184 isoform X3 [Triticum aestivum]
MITLKFNMCLRACLRVSCQLLEQRAMICNAVAIAEIMDATLILPVLKQDHMKRPDMDHSNRCTIHTMVFMVIQVERRDTRGDEIPEALRAGFSDVIEVAQHSYIVMAAKNVLAAAAATPSVPAFRAPYCKYTFWIGVWGRG